MAAGLQSPPWPPLYICRNFPLRFVACRTCKGGGGVSLPLQPQNYILNGPPCRIGLHRCPGGQLHPSGGVTQREVPAIYSEGAQRVFRGWV